MKWKPPTPSTNEAMGRQAAGGQVSKGCELGGGRARGVGDREGPASHVGGRRVEEGRVQWGSSGDSGHGPPAHPGVGQEDGTGCAGGRVLTHVLGWAHAGLGRD